MGYLKGYWNMNTIKCALLIAVFFFSLSATRVIAESVEMSYDVYSKKSRVGTIKTKRTRVDNKEKPTLIIDTIGEVRVKVLFYKYSLDFTENSVIVLHEGLISYESDTTENGKQKLVKGVFSGDSFNLSVTKKGEITKSTVLREKYETTSVETVEKRVGKNEAKRQFSVLDLDKPSIENWILGYEKEEMITIDNREFL